MSNRVFWGIITILTVGIVGFVIANNSSSPSKGNVPDKISGVQTYSKLNNKHVAERVNYPQKPSVGGNHNQIWIDCTAKTYDQELPEEMATHSLEHGAVWVTYKPDLLAVDIAKIQEKVKKSGNTFSSPYPGLSSAINLSSWGNQLKLDNVKDPRIDQFMVKYRKGPMTPEPGATCVAPEGAAGMPQGGGQPSGGSGLAPGETPEQHAREGQQ